MNQPSDQGRLIDLARGEIEADLLITNVQLVNTLSGEISRENVAAADGLILGFGDYPAKKVFDGREAFLCPGFIDAHLHIESSLLTPVEFARAAARRGTSSVVCDPHEIANVLGVQGLEYFIRSTRDLPLKIHFMLPSCVPATHMETAGAELSARDLERLLNNYPDRFTGLGEMMNFPGLLYKDPEVLAKLRTAGARPIDGHAPGLSGKDLNAYILAGPQSDHECESLEEAREKLAKGMHIMIREGTSAHNLKNLLPMVSESNWPGFSLVCDDRHPEDLHKLGHLDHNLRLAVAQGLDPVRAVQMVSINPARHFGLKRQGAIAPGYAADMVLVKDLENFEVRQVFLNGLDLDEACFESRVPVPGNSMHVALLDDDSLKIPAGTGRLRAIGLVPGQIVTREVHVNPRIENGLAEADPDRDLVKLAVVERHEASGNIGLGFVQGLGLKKGALASTVAHDAHNLILAGTSDRDMLTAARAAVDMGGGLVAALEGRVLAALPLPVAGLMSTSSLEETVVSMHRLHEACKVLGLKDHDVFMNISFLSLPVIPELKLTDKGLVDVNKFSFVDLWTK